MKKESPVIPPDVVVKKIPAGKHGKGWFKNKALRHSFIEEDEGLYNETTDEELHDIFVENIMFYNKQ